MAGFVTKKIDDDGSRFSFRSKAKKPQSLGKLLKAARTKASLTIEQVEEITKICAKYLVALEQGDYSQLPAEAYNVGFVRKYAEALKLNQEKIVGLYREERSRQHFSPASHAGLLQPRKKGDWQFLITPRLLTGIATVAVFGSLVAYIVVQVNRFAQPPTLQLTNVPAEFTSDKDTVSLQGKTAEGAVVTINAEPIVVQATGSFTQNVQLSPGINEIVVAARSRAQKESRTTVKVLYNPNLAKAPESVTKE